MSRTGRAQGAEGSDAAPEVYSTKQVLLHWIIAALILVQLVMNEGIEAAFNGRMDGLGIGLPFTALAHMAVGGVVLGLTLWRLAVRWRVGVPPPEVDANPVIGLASTATHVALYALALGMPLTGMIAWFGQSEIAGELHELGKPLLLGVILLHALGALFEHSIMGNDTLARMLRPGGRIGKAGAPDDSAQD